MDRIRCAGVDTDFLVRIELFSHDFLVIAPEKTFDRSDSLAVSIVQYDDHVVATAGQAVRRNKDKFSGFVTRGHGVVLDKQRIHALGTPAGAA